MLRELAKITDDNELDGITALELEAAAANLRASQFIWRDKRNQARHYDLIGVVSENGKNRTLSRLQRP